MLTTQAITGIETKALEPKYLEGLPLERVKSFIRQFANDREYPDLQLLIIFSEKRSKRLMAVSVGKDTIGDYGSEIDIDLRSQKGDFIETNVFRNKRQIEGEVVPRRMFRNRSNLHTMYATNDLPDIINIFLQNSSVIFHLVQPYLPKSQEDGNGKHYTDY